MGTAPCPPGTDGAAATEDVERASNHAIAPSRFLRRTAAAHALVSLLPGTATRTTARSTVPLEAGAAGVAAVAVAAPVLKQGAVASHDTRRTAAMRARACPKGGTATRTRAPSTAPCPPGTDGAAATEDVERASNHAIAPSRFL